jgi:hypothetical protein
MDRPPAPGAPALAGMGLLLAPEIIADEIEFPMLKTAAPIQSRRKSVGDALLYRHVPSQLPATDGTMNDACILGAKSLL